MQIIPGVYLINGAPYGRYQNSYLIHSEGATLIIDSGDLDDGACLPEVERNAARWGFKLEQASHMLVTHPHYDHSSDAAALQRRGLKIVASPATARSMAAGDEMCIAFSTHRPYEPCRADVILADGEELAVGGLVVRVIAAPGHTEGLVVFEIQINGERCWFIGDLFVTSGANRAVEMPWAGSPDFDRAQYVRTLAKLSSLPCDNLFPGHGPAALGFGRRMVEMAYTDSLTRYR
jgi:glyoxylase-like metal-dependent hydrolase (beta-lactamase superfamily II)